MECENQRWPLIGLETTYRKVLVTCTRHYTSPYIIFPLIFLEATIWIKIFYILIKYTNVTNLEGIVSMQNDRKGPIELNRLDQIV